MFEKIEEKIAEKRGWYTQERMAEIVNSNLRSCIKATNLWKKRAEDAEDAVSAFKTDESMEGLMDAAKTVAERIDNLKQIEQGLKTVEVQIDTSEHPLVDGKDIDPNIKDDIMRRLGELVYEEAHCFMDAEENYIVAVTVLQNGEGDC